MERLIIEKNVGPRVTEPLLHRPEYLSLPTSSVSFSPIPKKKCQVIPILICLGAHNIHSSNVVAPSDTDKFFDMVLRRPGNTPSNDATVITSMASVSERKGIPVLALPELSRLH